jgi:hypothetical protein
MRSASVQHRHQFFRGMAFGLILIAIKLVLFLPVDIADVLYGVAILLSLIITVGELLGYKYFTLEARYLDFLVGFLFPLDCYAVLVLFGIPLTS